MPKSPKAKPAGLTINLKTDHVRRQDDESPDTNGSPMNLQGIDLSSFGGDFGTGPLDLPPLPLSPPSSPGHAREPSKSVPLPNSSRSRTISEQEQRADPPHRRQAKDDDESRPGSSSMSKIYHLRKHPGSTPELSLVGSAENVGKQSSEVSRSQILDSRPQLSPHQSEESVSRKPKEKVFRNPLARSKSIRRDSNSKPKPSSKSSFDHPPKTAPLSSDWPGSSNMLTANKNKGKERRGKSAERAVASESEDNKPQEKTQAKDKDKHGFVMGSKNVMSKAKTGGGQLFNRLGKIGRSASSDKKEIPDSEYVMKVINLPLVEQTRITRISKDLGSCRDKTEYWMPSLPWRCVDYLNLNCESEGLYRVPGSGPQVKHWQRRFDSELDVDLLDEHELYDPNNIGSMLKSWLRELPTEIFPKNLQHALAEDLAKDNPDYQKIGQPAPQKLRNALSDLPPFNYYLLFAITCHLSLLLSHKEKNKMDLNNLSICIGPCLDLERWLFNYLVGDWRHCWQGCFTEKQYLDGETELDPATESQTPAGQPENKATNGALKVALNERAVHSSGSNGSASTSRKGSQQEIAKQGQGSYSSRDENLKPDTFRSASDSQQFDGGIAPLVLRKPVTTPTKRPATAGKSSDDEKSGTPKSNEQAHGRSRSEFAAISPVKPQAPMDFQFDTRSQ